MLDLQPFTMIHMSHHCGYHGTHKGTWHTCPTFCPDCEKAQAGRKLGFTKVWEVRVTPGGKAKCSSRCRNSQSRVCECACGGHNHGNG